MFQAYLPFVSSSCKNEIDPLPLSQVFPLVLELECYFHLPDSRSSYSPGEHFRISNRVFLGWVWKKNRQMKRILGACRAASNHARGKLR